MDIQLSLPTIDRNVNPTDAFQITQAQFLDDHEAKTSGTTNPSIMNKPFWKFMIARGGDAYWAKKRFVGQGYQPDHPEPVWCFKRFGGTATELPDGRLVFIGGEHEDFYDPDFFIYNDVVVIAARAPSNSTTSSPLSEKSENEARDRLEKLTLPEEISIYGYPLDVFPPTDFHTSTYFHDPDSNEESIFIIGGLGYLEDASRTQTEVYQLHVSDWHMERLVTRGSKPPGGTYRHTAKLVEKTKDLKAMINIRTIEGREFSLHLDSLEWV